MLFLTAALLAAETIFSAPADGRFEGGTDGFYQLLPQENAEVYSLQQETLWNVVAMVRLCARESNALLVGTADAPAQPPRRRLSFLALEREFSENEFRGGDIPLPVTESAQRGLHRIFLGLVRRNLRERLGLSASAVAEHASVQLIAAGLVHRVLVGSQRESAGNPFVKNDFRLLRGLFERGCFPDVKRLLDTPPPAGNEALLRIYFAHCAALLEILENASKYSFPEFLEAWWREESTTKSTSAALEVILRKNGTLRTAENLQLWYERNALRLVNESPAAGKTLPEVRERLDTLLTISFLTANAIDGGIVRVRLEELPKAMKDYPKLDRKALGDLQNALLRFQRLCPPLLQPPVGLFQQAVAAYSDGDMRTFRDRLAEGRAKFDSECARQERADEMLDQAEKDDKTKRMLREWLNALDRRKTLQKIDETIGW